MVCAGTSLETQGRSIRDIFEADIAPRLRQAPQVFPEASLAYEAFRRAADLVQTRAFHMKADNWLTGASQVGLWRVLRGVMGRGVTREKGLKKGGLLTWFVERRPCHMKADNRPAGASQVGLWRVWCDEGCLRKEDFAGRGLG